MYYRRGFRTNRILLYTRQSNIPAHNNDEMEIPFTSLSKYINAVMRCVCVSVSVSVCVCVLNLNEPRTQY